MLAEVSISLVGVLVILGIVAVSIWILRALR